MFINREKYKLLEKSKVIQNNLTKNGKRSR